MAGATLSARYTVLSKINWALVITDPFSWESTEIKRDKQAVVVAAGVAVTHQPNQGGSV